MHRPFGFFFFCFSILLRWLTCAYCTLCAVSYQMRTSCTPPKKSIQPQFITVRNTSRFSINTDSYRRLWIWLETVEVRSHWISYLQRRLSRSIFMVHSSSYTCSVHWSAFEGHWKPSSPNFHWKKKKNRRNKDRSKHDERGVVRNKI